MNKIGIVLTGVNMDLFTLRKFRDKLLEKGSDLIEIHDKPGAEKMQVNIAELTSETNLEEEVAFILSTAIDIQYYEKERDKVINKFKRKVKNKLSRKHIN